MYREISSCLEDLVARGVLEREQRDEKDNNTVYRIKFCITHRIIPPDEYFYKRLH